MTRIVLADDHPIVRTGIAALLAEEDDLEVVGQASDGLEALALVEALRPDVLVLDLMLPGLSGLEVNRRVARAFPETRVCVLTLHSNEDYAVTVLEDGAMGYMLKDAQPAAILAAVRDVAAGRRHFSRRLGDARRGERAVDPWTTLTAREREVTQLVAEGNSHAEAGARLGISPRTVEVHRANAMKKLQLERPADLLRYLMRRGTLPPLD